MLIITESMFVRIMNSYSPLLFSEEALKLIHQLYSQNNFPVEFREMDIEMSFNEESYFDCIENNDIPVEGLANVSSEFEEIESIIKPAISTFFGLKGVWVTFTSRHTVVYESRD